MIVVRLEQAETLRGPFWVFAPSISSKIGTHRSPYFLVRDNPEVRIMDRDGCTVKMHERCDDTFNSFGWCINGLHEDFIAEWLEEVEQSSIKRNGFVLSIYEVDPYTTIVYPGDNQALFYHDSAKLVKQFKTIRGANNYCNKHRRDR